MAAGSAAVLTNFIINLCIFIGCYVAFSLLRVRPWARRFFASRRLVRRQGGVGSARYALNCRYRPGCLSHPVGSAQLCR